MDVDVVIVVDVLMIVMPVVAYAQQLRTLVAVNVNTSFNPWLCCILIFSSVLRAFFWIGKRFEVPLLLQALVMLAFQLVLLKVCVDRRRPLSKHEHAVTMSQCCTKVWWMRFWDWVSPFGVVVVAARCGLLIRVWRW